MLKDYSGKGARYILPKAFKGAVKAIRMHSPENAFKFIIPRYMRGELKSLSI